MNSTNGNMAGTTDLLNRHADWWQRRGSLYGEVAHAPLGDLWLPLADGSVARDNIDVLPEMLDLDRLAGPARDLGTCATEGDLFRIEQPFVRVPWVEAILGAPVRATISGGSMRSKSFVSNWDEWFARDRRGSQVWVDTLIALTQLLAERVGGTRAIAPTLMRGPCDLAEAVLGPELMCFSMGDHPAELRRFLEEATGVFVETLRAQLAVIPIVSDGYVNPFGIWAPGTVVRTQCDASAILSPAHYAEWYLPWDAAISEAFDFSIIHLHSVSLHTVAALMRVERPQAIQVTIETTPGAPSMAEMLPTFRQILAAKCLVVDGQMSAGDLALLRDHLPQDGLCIVNRLDTW